MEGCDIVIGIDDVFIGVAINGLSGIAGHLSRKGLKCITGDESTVLERVHQRAVNIITEDLEWDDSLDIESIRIFLESPEVGEIVRQIYSVHILNKTDQDSLMSIHDEYIKLSSILLVSEDDALADSANAIFDLLIRICDLVLKAGIEEGMLPAHEAMSSMRYNLLYDELKSIHKNLEILKTSKKPNVQEFIEFERKYRAQVGSRHENITAPDFDAVRKRPIDSVYVNPMFTPVYPKRDEVLEDLSIPEFLSVSYRSVIIGNPGSGKSTFAIKLCHDLATRYVEKLFSGRQVTPILVILRDYGAEKKATKCSILKFIEMTANSNYQISPPNGAFEYMLLNGRSVIIFDGLDELLETNYRQEISSDIETFCTLYPSVPVLVTSREVGYEQAPLDQTRFEVFRLASFNDDQVKEYVTKWFAADTDLTPDEQKRKSEGFLEESRFVPDLRENPLILALLCNIYRGENYIPKNRPDVYEKCANMLFERWDKGRNLYLPLPFHALIRPAMMHLAYQIYTDEKLHGGVSEKTLIKMASQYLYTRRFEDPDEAEMAAIKFVEFCRGRAWVFTEVGSTEEGEGLYHFTHRTFLEYFSASHLTRIYITPERLIEFLHPRIAKREWNVVAQLAFQIQNKSFEDAGDELMSLLLMKASESKDNEKWNILSFAAQCLEFIIPSPAVTRSINIACIDLCLAFGINQMMLAFGINQMMVEARFINHVGFSIDADPREILGYLLNSTTENRTIIANSVEKIIVDRARSSSEFESYIALELGINLSMYLQRMRNLRQRDFWEDVSNRIYDICEDKIMEFGKNYLSMAIFIYNRDELVLNELVEIYGVESGIFGNAEFYMFPNSRIRSIADSILYLSMSRPVWRDKDINKMREIGKVLLSVSPPWIVDPNLELNGIWQIYLRGRAHSLNKHYNKLPLKIDSDTFFGFFALMASEIEHVKKVNESSQIIDLIKKSNARIFDSIRWTFVARFEYVDENIIRPELELCGFRSEQKSFIWRWIQHEMNLVDLKLKESDHSI